MSEQLLNEILQKLNNMDNRMNAIEKDIQTIKTEMATKTDIETIFGEQQKDVIGVLHVIKNQITEQTESTNNRLDRISMDINYLVRKTAEHENDILSLKRAR
jgi:CII-binding regulator of phage lambda lysogenization HflD